MPSVEFPRNIIPYDSGVKVCNSTSFIINSNKIYKRCSIKETKYSFAFKEVFLRIPLTQTLPDVLHNENRNSSEICMADHIVKRIILNYLHANVSAGLWFPQGIHTWLQQSSLQLKIIRMNNDTMSSNNLAYRREEVP
jgi:hypothetical protein